MPPHIRAIVSGVLTIATVLSGCDQQEGASSLKTVTIAQLGKETDDLVFFSYVGSDADFHYFTVADEIKYRVARSQWNNPAAFPADGTMRFFMIVKDGKLTTPDQAEMSKLSEAELLRPSKKR